MPLVRASPTISARVASALASSSSPVGSSASSSAGRWARAAHSANRCRSPPDSSPGHASARSASAAASSSSSTRARRSRLGTPRSASGSATASRIRRSGLSAVSVCCPRNPTSSCRSRDRERAGIRPMSRPSTRTTPADGGWIPATTRSSVLFPAPLGPSTHSTSPRASSRFVPARAAASPSLVRCTQNTSRSSTTGSLIDRSPAAPAIPRTRAPRTCRRSRRPAPPTERPSLPAGSDLRQHPRR